MCTSKKTQTCTSGFNLLLNHEVFMEVSSSNREEAACSRALSAAPWLRWEMDILYDYNVYSSKERINLHKQGRLQHHRRRSRECWGFIKRVKAQRSHLYLLGNSTIK